MLVLWDYRKQLKVRLSMNRIIKTEMNVLSTNYTLCIFEVSFEDDGTVHDITQVKTEVKNIIRVIETLKKRNVKMMN